MALDPSDGVFRFGMDIDIDGPTVIQPIVLYGSGGFCSANHPEQNTNVLQCNYISTRQRCIPINTIP